MAAQFCCAIRRNSAQFGAILRRRLRLLQTSDVTAVNRAEWRDAMDLETTRKALVAAVEAKKVTGCHCHRHRHIHDCTRLHLT